MKRSGKRTRKHKEACRKYRRKFLLTHGYIFCESCNANEGFVPHSVHHIQSAGRYPSHEHLHNPLNLIMLCLFCHNDFHASKRREEHDKLIEERGLLKLFKGEHNGT